MMKNNAIVIISKEISEEILSYYKDSLLEADIFIITPSYDSLIQDKYPSMFFKNDNDILNRSLYENIEQTDRPNWYYQQFLKYSAVLMFYNEYKYALVHIIDGDSYLRKDMFLKEKIFYTPKKIELQYQNFIDQLGLKLSDEKNFISNQMCFNPEYLREMLVKISGEQDWIEIFLKIILENEECWFSEYQLYACYVKYSQNIEEIPLKIFRRIDLINVSLSSALKKYFVVSTEIHHKKGFLRKIRAYLYYNLGKNLG